MEKENVKKDEALKALQNQVSEETIKVSVLYLDFFFLVGGVFKHFYFFLKVVKIISIEDN